ncbi:MAG TPA: arsenic resistance N-acetyltransferase ArsN2 [Longimicrobiales bacterium]
MSEFNRAEWAVRRSRPEDLPPVLELLEGAGLPVAGVEEWFEHFVVAEAGGRIVGVAGLEVYGTDGLLRSVAVASEWRGRGLGRALTEAVLEAAAREGVSAVYLLTETAESFFRGYAFRRIAREEASEAVKASVEFREVCPASSAVMVRSLAAAS